MESLDGQRTSAWLRSFVPTRVRYSWLDLARGGAGAFAGIVVASVLVRTIGGGPIGLPFIVAPIGASAVLVFAAPASPLAHPWAVFGGNTASAAVGIAAAKVFDDRMTAAAVAVGAAIIVMMLLGVCIRRAARARCSPQSAHRPSDSRASPSRCGRWQRTPLHSC